MLKYLTIGLYSSNESFIFFIFKKCLFLRAKSDILLKLVGKGISGYTRVLRLAIFHNEIIE